MWRSCVAGFCVAMALGAAAPELAHGQAPARAKEIDREREEAVRAFATRMHRLALQSEQAGDHDKAKSLLRLLLQATPNDAEAKAMLDRISRQELSANKTVVKVLANQSWQNTGVQVFKGKPLVIEAKGNWVLRMNRVVSADGLEVPDDMRDFPLGSLIGLLEPTEAPPAAALREARPAAPAAEDPMDDEIRRAVGLPDRAASSDPGPAFDGAKLATAQAPRPFLIGSSTVFSPQHTGVLYLKIHDSKVADNSGELTVTISGQIRLRSGSVSHVAKTIK